ncbi:gonadal somatic cell derived factor isoform X1 [Synchiropus splendidus]|uniref:gonadal somatic cell derived factor isoform X1 n=1 Tax=Synchiropus splendidus TaxID=270530 RepID=UPI00237E4DF4|nr:gonadal somatic cell derived factor isoform X1 [Synchiropus splendidus]
MSFVFSLTVMLILGSTAVIGFVVNPAKGEPTPSDSTVTRGRCHVSSLQSIRKHLLDALNLQTEPRLPAGGADRVRELWLRVAGSAPQLTGNSAAAAGHLDVGNGTSPNCCSVSSEVLMTDLGWDTWVILPKSVTIIECAVCNAVNTLTCPLSLDSDFKMPCCQPTSKETVPFLYLDGSATVVLSSVELPRSCSCRPGNAQPPANE